jgi:hypothetical protein
MEAARSAHARQPKIVAAAVAVRVSPGVARADMERLVNILNGVD